MEVALQDRQAEAWRELLAPPGAPAGALRILRGASLRVPDADRLRDALAAVPPGGTVAVLYELEPLGKLRRIGALLGLRSLLRRSERALAKAGAAATGSFAVHADERGPRVAYTFASPAASYARCNMILGVPRTGAGAVAYRWLGRFAGCAPSTQCVVAIGRRP